jgi:exodeoxyribonuclease V alpha subunit
MLAMDYKTETPPAPSSGGGETDSFAPLDLHFARLIERLSGEPDELLLLTAALVSSAVQRGHICIDLENLAGTAIAFDNNPGSLQRWPTLDLWIQSLERHPTVGAPGAFCPLILSGTLLYLFRYWDYERQISSRLLRRETDEFGFDSTVAKIALPTLFPLSSNEPDRQKIAAAVALLKKICFVSGGPGTGKTATVVKIMALLLMTANDSRYRIALAAPTGKAAARLEASIAAQLPALPCTPEILERIPCRASTIHALLGPIPGTPRFRHDEKNPLSYDAVIIDEASMIDVALMARLFRAIEPDKRIIFLGDKDQLASVEAGAIFGDLCDAGTPHGFSGGLCAALHDLMPDVSLPEAAEPPIADRIVTLRKNYRFPENSGIGMTAKAINDGNADMAISLLKSAHHDDCAWWEPPSHEAFLERLRSLALDTMAKFAAQRDPLKALDQTALVTILCAVRDGPYGVTTVNRLIERFLAEGRVIKPEGDFYSGKRIMITRNDRGVDLYNGDIGILLPDRGGTLKAFFPDGKGGARSLLPHLLPHNEPAFAMTVHKAQGSEFDRTVLILPPQPSPVVTRELLYTAATRTRSRVEFWCAEQALRRAVASVIRRKSGLRDALWSADRR